MVYKCPRWAWGLLRNKAEPAAVSMARGLEKHWGMTPSKCNGLLSALSHPHFPYLPPTPSLFFLVSSIVPCLSWLPSSSFPPSSFSLWFLSHSPYRRNALHVYDALQFRESVGIYELINLTATLASRYCPRSADDEIEAVGDEVTCLKIHSHVAVEAGGDLGFFSPLPWLHRSSLWYSSVLTYIGFPRNLGSQLISSFKDPKDWLLFPGGISRESQICLPKTCLEFWGCLVGLWSLSIFRPTEFAHTPFWWYGYCGQKQIRINIVLESVHTGPFVTFSGILQADCETQPLLKTI